MLVSRWGNSLAIRLPKKVVDVLGLKEGDEVKITLESERLMRVGRDHTRKDALSRLRALHWELPTDFQFDRDEAHERD